MKRPVWLLALSISYSVQAQEYRNYSMWDPSLPFEQRVNDLVSRLTLEEKVAQMLNAAPAIPRLGIPAYDWWNEVLHGVARTPFKTTVYPQAIAMAATWDTNSLKLMAFQSAVEGRAVHNKATALGRNNERYMGLTYWTPNINIFRDPRWGRGQETYGEDPFLTAKLGSAFVRGLQGNHPKYLLAAACAKHFAVHSGPEPSRHSDNFDVSEYELWDTYLPAFKELVVDAKVAGVMCAYNAFRTEPCCANSYLMNEILRKRWNFSGYVTSDCWALDDLFKFHKTHPDATAAAVDALLHGNDVECGVSVYIKLTDAVREGKVTEAQIDESVRRLFMIRYRLGMFDPPSMVPYAQTTDAALEAKEHYDHALKLARQSIVLLKNERNTLPLSKNIKRIAVIGPNANNKISVLGNYNGTPSRIVSVLDGLKEKLGPNVEVMYEEGIHFVHDTLFVAANDPSTYAGGFKLEFFNNTDLEGPAVHSMNVPEVNLFFSEGQRPAQQVNASHYSLRASAKVIATGNETIVWQLEGDDGYRLYVNDSLRVDAWSRNRWGARTFRLNVKQGQEYKIVLEHWQGDGSATIKMVRGAYVRTDLDALAKKVSAADVIIFAGGISPQLEGEEMRVNFAGFDGGDRTSILLPAVQTELMKKLNATGKPVVFVMMTGSAIAIPWESANIPAIVNAWYGGQSAGTAIADVLFGDHNPAGRLPVTFYKSDADLPGFKDYSMKGRTYRYFTGEALYPFGYGLSYSKFSYSHAGAVRTGMEGLVRVTATVANTGDRDGEEVVQCYVSFPGSQGKGPIRALKGFQRIHLKKGESREVKFDLTTDDLSLVDEHGNSYRPKGDIVVSIGGGQPGVRASGVAETISHTIKAQ
ncbi:MAG TPA: glycoside hydrolase family 3 C-terminal domain-containing protein [Phnomibacter sp.]|nr:glycoside hydrolase family 3 C-terminal domain-containing protein [Phnomibacter sp.]